MQWWSSLLEWLKSKRTYFLIAGKTQKLKRAKEEAQAEIKNYREEREKQFIDYQREVSECVVLIQVPSLQSLKHSCWLDTSISVCYWSSWFIGLMASKGGNMHSLTYPGVSILLGEFKLHHSSRSVSTVKIVPGE